MVTITGCCGLCCIQQLTKKIITDKLNDYFIGYCDDDWNLIEKDEFDYFIQEIINICFNEYENILGMCGFDYKNINIFEFQTIRDAVYDWEGGVVCELNKSYVNIIDKYIYFFAQEIIYDLPITKVLKNMIVYENKLYDEHIGRWHRFYEDLQKKKSVKQNMMKIRRLPNELVSKIVDDLFKSKNSCFYMRDFVVC